MSPYTQAVFVPRSSAYPLALDASPAALLYQLLVTDQRVNHYVVSPETAQLIDDYFADTKDNRLKQNYLLWRSIAANIADTNPAIPNDDGDLALPEYNDGVAAEVVQEKTLTTSDSATTWHTAFHARDIKCIPYAEFKEATEGTAQETKI